MRREQKITQNIYLSFSSLQNDYLNIDNSSSSVETMGEQILFRKNSHYMEVVNTQQIFFQKEKKKGIAQVDGDLVRQQT